jgi:hypothetical protein
MSSYKTKFWLEDYKSLFKDPKFLPSSSQSIQERMNSISRLIIILSLIIMLFFGLGEGITFLLIGLVIIISIYYGRGGMIQENYQPSTNFKPRELVTVANIPTDRPDPVLYPKYLREIQSVKQPAVSQIHCGPQAQYQLPLNQTQMSVNQNLADGNLIKYGAQCQEVSRNQLLANGGKDGLKVNRNTLIAPVVVPRPYEFQYWRANNLSGLSIINEPRMQDKYRSGYYVTSCNKKEISPAWDTSCAKQELFTKRMGKLQESIESYKPENNINDLKYSGGMGKLEGYTEGYNYQNNYSESNISPLPSEDIPNYPYTYSVSKINDETYMQPGDVLTAGGYNRNNLRHNLPSNLAVGNCQKNSIFNVYNKDLYTQTIQPGYYSRSQILDPISANIGISYDQQFVPTTVEKSKDGLTYLEHDPRVFKPEQKCENPVNPDINNVYDPRFYGYGTSYRSYVDRLTGQPRFYYDDIDAIRRPNYITRSKIDTFDYAETYGPMKPQEKIISDDNDIRSKVQEQFLDDSLFFRTGLQESLMRKRNNELAQLRAFPHSRAGYKTGC